VTRVDDRWTPVAAHPPIAPDELCLFAFSLQASPFVIAESRLVLDQEELQRAERFRRPCDRERFIVKRATVRRILAYYSGCSPEALPIIEGPFGKPELDGDRPGNPIHFNVTDSQHLGLIAICLDREVGVDLECASRAVDWHGISRRMFTTGEISSLMELPDQDQLHAFYSHWTRKEAVVKALGRGLHFPLDNFELSIWPNCSENVADLALDGSVLRFWVRPLEEPHTGFFAAIATARRQPATVSCWRWEP